MGRPGSITTQHYPLTIPLEEVYGEIREIIESHAYREIPVTFSQLRWHMTLERLDVVPPSVGKGAKREYQLSTLGERQLAERIGIGNVRKFLSEKTLLDVNTEINAFLSKSPKSIVLLERGGMIHGVATKRPDEANYFRLLDKIEAEGLRPVRLTLSDRELIIHTVRGTGSVLAGLAYTVSDLGWKALRETRLLYSTIMGYSIQIPANETRSDEDLITAHQSLVSKSVTHKAFLDWASGKKLSQGAIARMAEELEGEREMANQGLMSLGLASTDPQNAPMAQLEFERVAGEWLVANG